MQNDLISRSALWAVLRNIVTSEEVEQAIADAPAVDAVEVVRCKSCKHWQKRYETTGLCLNLNSVVTFTKKDFYCAKGERRADDGK